MDKELNHFNLYTLFFHQQGGDECFISCPSCRKPTQLPKIASDLPNAFLINSLLQLRDKLNKALSKVNTKCEIHDDPLKVYCETCEELICRDCTISQHHKNHQYKLVAECYPDHHQEIEAHLTTVKKKVADVDVAVTNLISQEREITKQGEDVKKEIHIKTQMFERHLVQQVDTAVQQKLQLITNQREEAEMVLKQLKGCEEFVEQSLKLGSEQQVLRDKQNMIQVMTTVNEDVNPIVFHPAEEAITFTGIHTLVEGIDELSKRFDKTVVVKKTCYPDTKSTINLNFETHDGSAPVCPFTPSLTSSPGISFTPHSNSSPGSPFTLCSTPSLDGAFTPHSTSSLDNTYIPYSTSSPNTPLISCTIQSPKMKGKPVHTISGLSGPVGVVAFNEDILVVERDSHRITILNKEGKKVRSFGRKGKKTGQFTDPSGIAISYDGHILVTHNHRIQKLTFKGECLRSVGCDKPSICFNNPKGITVHPNTGQIFVADTNNDVIHVFNIDLFYCYSFSSAPEPFHCPYDLAFDIEEYLYVVDYNNHCVKKFTSTGKYILRFGSKGYNLGELYHPTSIIIYNNVVYVTELINNRVSVFDTNGRFMYCFGKQGEGEGEFNHPYFITVDLIGNLYVSDTLNNRLVVL